MTSTELAEKFQAHLTSQAIQQFQSQLAQADAQRDANKIADLRQALLTIKDHAEMDIRNQHTHACGSTATIAELAREALQGNLHEL